MDKNLEQRFDEFKAKFHNKMVAFEKKVKGSSPEIFLNCQQFWTRSQVEEFEGSVLELETVSNGWLHFNHLAIYYFANWGKYLKMFPPKYAQGERWCVGRLLSFPIRYDRPIHRGNNKAINYLYLHWTVSNHEINGEIKLLASDSTSSCLPSSGWRPPPRRSITPHIISCFDWKPQEDRRKIPEGASLGLYREDGKEHRKPVYKQVEEWFCVEQLSTQFVDLIGLIKVDGNYRLHFNSDGQWVVSRLGSPIPG